MSHAHSHQHGHDCAHGVSDGRRLLIAFVIIAVFMVVEIIGGLISGSLALLADAGHMAADAGALLLALVARWLAKREMDTDRFPFGLQRAQVIAGFLNGLGLVILVAWLIWESVTRFFNPQEILAGYMLSVALAGLGANIAAFLVLHQGNMKDLNMRGAMLHVISDIFGSAAAILSAIVIWLTGWVAIDAILTLIVCTLILRSAFPLLNEAARVLLQGAPLDFDSDAISQRLRSEIPEIDDIHEMQVWMLTPEEPRLAMHIQIHGPEKAQKILARVKKILAEEYQIEHSTIQIECPDCPDKNIFHDDHRDESHGHGSATGTHGHLKEYQEAVAKA